MFYQIIHKIKKNLSSIGDFLKNVCRPFFLSVLFVGCLPSYAALQQLSLEDAIFLAIRENPNVQNAQLNHVLQKYSLQLAQWQFKPHYSFTANAATARMYAISSEGYVSQNTSGLASSVDLLTPYGTKGSLSASADQTDHYHPGLSLEILQPLMRGFGRPIVEAELFNARDNDVISKLTVENTLRTTITSVVNAYLDVLAAQKKLSVDEDALARANLSVNQTTKFIKSGRKAGVELFAVETEVANVKTNIENDKNALAQARFALLTAIGINPNSIYDFSGIDIQKLIKKFTIPTLGQTKQLALAHDIQYQIDEITLKGAKRRSLLAAEDNTRWELNLKASARAEAGNENNSGIKSIVNGINQTTQVSLNLTIPIDDFPAKVALQNAKIGLKLAGIALQQEQWAKETNAINSWQNLYSAERALYLAENANVLQKKTYQISLQKYSHGLIDSLQLQSAQQQLINNEQALNYAKINYLKALVNLDQLLGRTLKTWNVKVRYG